MARRNVYLGRKVKDVKPRGLTHLKEVRGIARAILRDFKAGRISYRKAMSRLNLLSLVAKKAARKKHVKFKWSTAKRVIDGFRKRLMKLRKK